MPFLSHVTTLAVENARPQNASSSDPALFSSLKVFDLGNMFTNEKLGVYILKDHMTLLEALQGDRDQDIANILCQHVRGKIIRNQWHAFCNQLSPVTVVNITLQLLDEWPESDSHDITFNLLVSSH